MTLGAVGTATRAVLGVTLALVVSSCAHHTGSGGTTTAPPSLSETAWHIEQVGDSSVTDASKTELRFGGDGKVSGSTGCNNFTGSATIEGANVAFSPLAATRKACDQALMEQEGRIFGALQSVKSFAFAVDGRLNLLGADGKSLVRLARAQ